MEDSTIFPLGLIELCEARHGFAKSTQEVASIYPDVEPIDATSCIVLRIHVWLRKAFEPERQIVDCWTAGWSPSDVKHTCSQYSCVQVPTTATLTIAFHVNYDKNTKEYALFLLKTLNCLHLNFYVVK